MQFIDKMGEGGGGSVYPLLHSVPHEAQQSCFQGSVVLLF